MGLVDGKRTFNIDVDPDTTVLDLKKKVFDKTAFNVDSFYLTLKPNRIRVSDLDTLNSLALKCSTKDFEFDIHHQGLLAGMVC